MAFLTIETMSNKKGKKNLVTHMQSRIKKIIIIIIERYMHSLVSMKLAYLY